MTTVRPQTTVTNLTSDTPRRRERQWALGALVLALLAIAHTDTDLLRDIYAVLALICCIASSRASRSTS
jgi:hypothetical protein